MCYSLQRPFYVKRVNAITTLAEMSGKITDLCKTSPQATLIAIIGRQIFKNVSLKQDSKASGRWETNHEGEYFGAGTGGAVTVTITGATSGRPCFSACECECECECKSECKSENECQGESVRA